MGLKQPKILIVDDEPNVCFILERTLRHENYLVAARTNGLEAIQMIQQETYDLVMLDLQMEPVNGIQVLNAIRKQDPDTVVIILTAHGTMESAVEALRLEAFDYLFKPAAPDTIRERVHQGLDQREKLLRRKQLLSQIDILRKTLNELETTQENLLPSVDSSRFLRSGKLVIDRHHRATSLDNHLLDLTAAEYDILLAMVEAAPKVISSAQLVKIGLGYETEDSEAREIIKVYIHHLRQKIEPEPSEPVFIKTVRGQGYLWSG